MIRWQRPPTLRRRLQRADPSDLAILALGLAVGVVAAIALGGLLTRLATLSHGA